MKLKFTLIILLFDFYLSYSNAPIYQNPVMSEREFNIVNYTFIIKEKENKMKGTTFNEHEAILIAENLPKIYYQSYVFGIDLFIFKNDSEHNFLLFNKKYYSIFEENGEYFFMLIKNLNSSLDYFGYIQNKSKIFEPVLKKEETEVNNKLNTNLPFEANLRRIDNSNPKPNTDIIIYGKINNELCFYYIDSNSNTYLNQFSCTSFETPIEHISCKLLNKTYYICAYSFNYTVQIKIFSFNNLDEDKEAGIIYVNEDLGTIKANIVDEVINLNFSNEDSERENSNFKNHDYIILYDTNIQTVKILCARNIYNSEIECSRIDISFPNPIDPFSKEFDIDFTKFNNTDTNSFYITFSYNEDNCNYTLFNNSEYLICCGKTNIIICERRDMELKLINLFNITLTGIIRNLTVENENYDGLKLIYNNIISEGERNIFEYYIFPPKCTYISYKLFSSQLTNYYINLDDLYERKTDTNYYITINNIISENGEIITIRINEQQIQIGRDKKSLKMDGNILTFITSNNKNVEKYHIKYNISIDETYSTECSIYLEIIHCYHSCKTCSKDIPTEDNHYCLSCNEEEGYYPSSSSSDFLFNCYKNRDTDSKNEISYNSKSISNELTTLLSNDIICYNTCISCNKSFEINEHGLINHNCQQCAEGYYFKYGTNNCYSNETIEKGYYLDKKGNVIYWKECYEKCETCDKLGNATNMNCLSYKNNLDEVQVLNSLDSELEANSNYIEKCKNNSYLAQNGDCVSDCPNNTYKFEQNKTCLEYCPSNYEINQEHNECKEKIEQITQSELKSQIINNISSLINTVNSSKMINGSDFIALIMPSDMNPKEQLKNGISAIDLGNCTDVLKDYYNISKDENIYVLNIESKRDDIEKSEDNSFNLGKNVQLEAFDKYGKHLNLSICENNIQIMSYIGDIKELDIQSALSLGRKGIDVFNPNDDYFNDICKVIDNDDGKDLIIKDRRADIYQNATFCQKGCSYSGVNYELLTADCICDSSLLQDNYNNNNDTKKGVNNAEENINFKTLTKSIIANLFNCNLEVFRCYNLVFNLKNLYDNIGFYCMSAMFIFQIIFLFIFLVKRLNPLKSFMLIFKNYNPKLSNNYPPKKNKKIINDNPYKSNKNENGKSKIIHNIKYKKENNNNSHSINDLIKMKKGKKIIFAKKYSKIINIQNPIININNQDKKDKKVKTKNFSKDKNSKANKKIKYLFNMETINEKNKNINKSKANKNSIIFKSDDDLQELNYENAIKYDKRTYLRIYWAFLIDKQIILSTFFTKNYFSLFIIKLSFLVCTFQISFFLNAFFYTDEYISNAYHNDGILDFFSGLPKSIYSLLATMAITNLLNILSNSKSELMPVVKRRNNYKNYLYIVNVKLAKIKNKLILYFILIFILGAVFLYYVYSFCSVYRNSQKYWFIGCLESFGMDFLFSIIICIFLAFFRYLAIKKHLKCLYIFTNIISAFL